MSLTQKVAKIRAELGLPEGQSLAETVDSAVAELGADFMLKRGEANLMRKVDACLETMGLVVQAATASAPARASAPVPEPELEPEPAYYEQTIPEPAMRTPTHTVIRGAKRVGALSRSASSSSSSSTTG